MRIVTRAEWCARRPRSSPQTVPISARSATCVHYDGAVEIHVSTLEQACARVRADQNYHMDHNRWADIGYNFLVTSAPGTPVDGLVFTGRGRDVIGAHCLNWNTPWIGVQVAIGGDQQPSPAALASVRALHDSFQASAGHHLAMKGHRDGFTTACPGPELYPWVRAGMPINATQPRSTTTPPSRGGTRPPAAKAPPFPLPRGWYFGPRSEPRESVSGYFGYGSDLAQWQAQMAHRGWTIGVDGRYGDQTAAVAKAFQSEKHLVADGLIGAATWRAAWLAVVT